MISNLTIEGGAYAYKMPTYFYPQYKKLKQLNGEDAGVPIYTFGYKIEVNSQKEILDVSKPSDSEFTVKQKGKNFVIEAAASEKIPRR